MTIGFFSPLPLAMMIPFMATQSLAMGEAFGKSFQYGKRKISSMSNEEFNKYTITDMMNEQTADIRTLIPKLTEQMAMSATMQQRIFEEMIKLVPAFVNAIQSSLTGKTSDAHNITTNLNIKHFDEQTPVGLVDPFQQAFAEEETKPPPDIPRNSFQYIDDMSLTDLSIENTKIRNGTSLLSHDKQTYLQSTYATKLQQKKETGDKLETIDEVLPPLIVVEQTPKQKEFNIWNDKLVKLILETLTWKKHLLNNPYKRGTASWLDYDKRGKVNQKTFIAKLRRISQTDSRHGNSFIQKRATVLRQELYNNAFT